MSFVKLITYFLYCVEVDSYIKQRLLTVGATGVRGAGTFVEIRGETQGGKTVERVVSRVEGERERE